MPVYEYSATDGSGRVLRGTVHGVTLDAAAKSLAAQGLSVQSLGVLETPFDPGPSVAPAREAPPTAPRSVLATNVAGPAIGTVPLPDLHFFFRQLGTMLHAGINPSDALETLSRNSGSAKLRSVIVETREHVVHGRPMSVGFQRYPEVFSPLMVSMVRAGEDGGFLDEQCRQLSEYIQRDIELRNMIRRETAMPKITVFVSILIILGANSIIGAMAPGRPGITPPTVIWIAASVIGVVSFLFVRFGLRIAGVRYAFDRFTLGLPWVGGMILGFAMAKFGRAFGALYRGGVPLPRAVELAADACGNEAVRARVYPAAKALETGAGISETFASTGAFSPLVLDMARTGETTGNMDQMLTKVAEFYEDEGQTQAQQSAKIIGVVCLLLVAAYVAYILVTFYGGYFGGLGRAVEG